MERCPLTGKTGSYLTWQQAEQDRKKINRTCRDRGMPPLTSVHRCKTCRMFHLTSETRERTRSFENLQARQRHRKTR